MKPLRFAKAKFIKSAAKKEQFLSPDLPEIALIGRSNVGKSSLINHLLKSEKLAKVSKTPGKTKLVNFFNIDDQITLVDLPGYGFAKVSRETRDEWGQTIDDYLYQRTSLKLLLVLLDLNRTPNDDDLSLIEWATHYNTPLRFIFTKSDKLNQKEQNASIKKNLEIIEPICRESPFVVYSIKDGKARLALITKINQVLT